MWQTSAVDDSTQQVDRRERLANTADARIFRTRTKLADALLSELRDDSKAISVGSVAARASVGRSTFYTHFATLDELVCYAVDLLFDGFGPDDLVSRRSAASSTRDGARAGFEDFLDRIEMRGRDLLKSRAPTVRVVVHERFAARFASNLQGVLVAEQLATGREWILAEYVAGGVTRVLVAWATGVGELDRFQAIDYIMDFMPSQIIEGTIAPPAESTSPREVPNLDD
ncbi:hypothetical protein GIY30_23040 [Gordonia sp. HNM0687]|uniref:HTH tetR-type domain-containing protein n=1 Tax=Gordonia mangrovi TaxID=2665643 RepID=A0A6L7GXA6_9ACTN|nr:TetR/AcrR family transcriptional regulator [Gordonia mangrovi]MXP24212.1 hypothetical protein [Gordonia mangrovi]UVF76898.1 TetR/AcrR family transcriptional regulator [Gordonia mangrovi]